eukprot:Pgem_evm1s616
MEFLRILKNFLMKSKLSELSRNFRMFCCVTGTDLERAEGRLGDSNRPIAMGM